MGEQMLRAHVFAGIGAITFALSGCAVPTGPTASVPTAGDEAIVEATPFESDAQSDVSLSKCGYDLNSRVGGVDATVTNSTSTRLDYEITIAFQSKDGSQQWGTEDAYIDDLQPGQTKVEGVTSFADIDPIDLDCVLVSATRSPSE